MRLRALLLFEEKHYINELSKEALPDIQENTLPLEWYKKFFKLADKVSEKRTNLKLRRAELNAEDVSQRFKELSLENTVFIRPSKQAELDGDLLIQDREEEQKTHIWRI